MKTIHKFLKAKVGMKENQTFVKNTHQLKVTPGQILEVLLFSISRQKLRFNCALDVQTLTDKTTGQGEDFQQQRHFPYCVTDPTRLPIKIKIHTEGN